MAQYTFGSAPEVVAIKGRFGGDCVLLLAERAEEALASGALKLRIVQHGNQQKIDNVKIEIGGMRTGRVDIHVGADDASVKLHGGCSGQFDIRLWRQSKVIVGDHTTSNGVKIVCDLSSVIIGKDCMFSDEILIQSADQHGIVDLKTGEITNNKERTIRIGDHVWLGRRSVIMPDVEIGPGSIIGAGAIVTKDIPATSIGAGIPAKVVKSDFTWCRSPTDLDWYASKLIKEAESNRE